MELIFAAGLAGAWPFLTVIVLLMLMLVGSWVMFPPPEPGPPHDSLQGFEGLDDAMAAKLRRLGVHSDRDLVRLQAKRQQEIENDLELQDGQLDRWRTQIFERWRSKYLPPELRHIDGLIPDPDLGGLFSQPPDQVDDLTVINEIDEVIANRLNTAGIYQLKQLRHMTPAQQESFKQRFNLGTLNFRLLPLTSGAKLPPRKLDVATNDEIVQEASAKTVETSSIPRSIHHPEFGRVYSCAPPHRDDLSTLDGIDVDAERKLNAVGIYTVSQLLNLSPQQRKLAHEQFGIQPDFDTSGKRDVNASSAPPGPASDNTASVGQAEMESADDLTRLDSVNGQRADQLKAKGISSFCQLSELSDEALAALAAELNCDEGAVHDWRRCLHAWSKGIDTKAQVQCRHRTGWLHGVRLPELSRGVFDGHKLVAYPEQVVFRGDNPSLWGSQVKREGTHRAVSLTADDVRSNINYVRIRRLDTRESVVTSITKGQLFDAGDEGQPGWHGAADEFFGGIHLGVCADDIPNEVETKFGLGGWGFGHLHNRNDEQACGWRGQLIPPTGFEVSVGHIGSPCGTVVFRSNDPTIWNQRVGTLKDRMAMPIDGVTHPITFLRMVRLDTGAGVIVRCDRQALTRCSDNPRLGWNGSCDHFSGGHHLGIFHRDMPQQVEVSFGYGGWGFGHPFGENNRQVCGWAGQRVDEGTIFEVSVLEFLPDYLRHELIE